MSASPLERLLRPGLSVLFGDQQVQEHFTRSSLIPEQLRIVFLLQGELNLVFGQQRVHLRSLTSQSAQAVMVTLNEPEELSRTACQGDQVKRISLGLDPAWLEESLQQSLSGGLTGSWRNHLATCYWHPSAHAHSLAKQMLNPPLLPSGLQSLYLESRAIELVLEAVAQTGLKVTASQPAVGLRPALYRRMCDLKVWLSEQIAQPLTLDQIAQKVNTTPATLQRHFRLAHGMTVFEFLQQERLNQARAVLEQQGASVTEAALLAGYTNPANFATAFKRHFGVSPRQIRRHL